MHGRKNGLDLHYLPQRMRPEGNREGSTILDVESGCKRGILYAEEELNDPRRMVASTVRIRGRAILCCPSPPVRLFQNPGSKSCWPNCARWKFRRRSKWEM
jgi:hypothetical protein